MVTAVSNIAFRGQQTNIKGSLDAVRLEALLPANGNRMNARNVVIVVTGGQAQSTNYPALTTADMTALKDGSTEVFVVMHSAYVNQTQSALSSWSQAVSAPDHLFTLSNYTQQLNYGFAQIIKNLMDATCMKTGYGAGVAATVDSS